MKVLQRVAIVVLLLALGACGGGGSSSGTNSSGGGVTAGGSGTGAGSSGGGSGVATTGTPFELDTGIGGSGGIIGDIDGFGSIIINGLEMSTDSAAFFLEGAGDRAQSDLREGQYVVIAGDLAALNAMSVYYRSNLKGPVSAPPVAVEPETGRYELMVLGQTVITTASTRFEGVLAEEIREGDLLEVSGPVDGDGRVLATYVGLKPALDVYKAIGQVADLDTAVRRFDLGGLQVSYGGADFVRLAEAALAEGLLVEVRMLPDGFTAPAAGVAEEVERLPVPRLGAGAELEVKGLIDTFVSPAEFTVSGIPVTTTAGTTFENGSAAQLGLNVEIEVDGQADASGMLSAERIEFEDSPAVRVEGPVTDVAVNTRTVTALGVPFQVRDGTRLVDRRDGVNPFTLDDLVTGDVVKARGFLEGELVVAVSVERFEPGPGHGQTLLRGPLTGFDKAAATLTVQNVTVVDGIGITGYEDEKNQPVDRDTFYDLLPDARELNVIWNDFGSLADPADRLTVKN